MTTANRYPAVDVKLARGHEHSPVKGGPAPDGNGEEDYLHHQQVLLDMSAPQGCPDATFPIIHRDVAQGRAEGAIVVDGQFIPENIPRTAAEAICNSYGETVDDLSPNDRVFIKKFLWHQDPGIIEVQTNR